MPWVGGINSSVDPGVLNSQELVQADNVVFSSTGARIKREALEYIDPAVPAPDFRSSSTTTRTLKWTTNALVNITSLNERLVVGERITVTGNANYNVTDVEVLTRTSVPQVTTVQCVADVSGSLNNKYFLISAGDGGSDYYVWFNVSGGGVDPALSGKTPIPVAISTNDTASTVATAVQTAVDAEADFGATVLTDTVTITNALGGVTVDGSAGNSGFTVTVTTKGGHEITYTGSSSLNESSTAAGLTVSRASSIISVTDYWRFDGSGANTQLLVYATDDFQLFKLDGANRRVQVHGQEQVTSVVCPAGGTITTGDYWLISSANDATEYYVWYNVDSGGGDPAIAGRTAIPVAISSADTASQVATATASALDALADFSASANVATVTITNAAAGITEVAEDVSAGVTISVTTYGATAPTSALSTIRTLVYNERLLMFFSGTGNKPIKYNPDENAKYQLLDPTAPDASFAFEHQGRIFCDDKQDKDLLHYSETFDETKWLGIGDSGAIPVSPGDGDPVGIINGYPYKGFAVIGKQTKRYRMLGDSPENYVIELISEGLGNEAALAIPVDEVDVVFCSRRGIHSQQATDTYGDTDAAYLSSKIKPTFTSWNASRLKFMQGAYIPELNSIALAVSEEGRTSNNAVWLYNIEVEVPGQGKGAWYRWPDISCQSLTRRLVNNMYKLVFGTTDGRLIQAQVENEYADFGTTGIEYRIRTGTLYVDDNPSTVKAFKSISLLYRPRGNFAFTVKAYVDNFIAQAWSFNQISGLDLLGDTFILGNSLLGASAGFAPYTFTMEGIGRGLVLEITQPNPDEQVEIWGVVVEYEPADIEQEVKE